MYEVEVKVRADHAAVREALASLDAASRGTVTQVDTYYDAPHRNFAETDEALRIRREERVSADAGGRADTVETVLTYKGPLVDADSKTRQEAETVVEDPGAARSIVASLGFEPAAEVRKERERFAVGEFTVTLDRVDGLGEFVEVEREAEEIDAAREGAFDVLERLGLDPDDQIRTAYLGLLLAQDN